jgi:dihydrofolate reductase
MARKLISFMVVTLDGFYAGPDDEFDWPNVDEGFNEFAISQMNDIDTLIFGRMTYQYMAAFWPAPEALESDPVVAERMNSLDKVVFSKTMTSADWQNSTLVTGDAAPAITELKQRPGLDLALFGSPTFTASLLEQGLVDEVRVLVNPILLGAGKSLYQGLTQRVPLSLSSSTVFRSGNVLLCYQPVAGR